MRRCGVGFWSFLSRWKIELRVVSPNSMYKPKLPALPRLYHVLSEIVVVRKRVHPQEFTNSESLQSFLSWNYYPKVSWLSKQYLGFSCTSNGLRHSLANMLSEHCAYWCTHRDSIECAPRTTVILIVSLLTPDKIELSTSRLTAGRANQLRRYLLL